MASIQTGTQSTQCRKKHETLRYKQPILSDDDVEDDSEFTDDTDVSVDVVDFSRDNSCATGIGGEEATHERANLIKL